MSESTNGFVFYQSYADAIRSLPVRSQLKALWAIIDKGLYNKDTELDGTAAGMYALIVPNIEANRKKYIRNAENGKRGGRPRSKTDEEPDGDEDDPDEDFENFWEAYPRKVNKQAAKAAWKRLNLSTDEVERISSTLTDAKERDPRFKEMQYTPFPAKWLENREWENDYKEPVSGSFSTDDFFESAIAAAYGRDVIS